MGHNVPERRPISAHTSPAPIRKAEVKIVNGSVSVDLLTEDHWSVVVLYLTAEAALDLSDRLEDRAAELIDASLQKVTLEELVERTKPNGNGSEATLPPVGGGI